MKNITRIQASFSLFILLLMLAGPGGCLPRLDPGPAPTRVRLAPAMPGPVAAGKTKHQIMVAAPSLAEDIDNDRLTLIFHGREVRHLAGVRWSSGLGSIMHDSLMKALESTGAFAGVGDEIDGLAAQRRLNSDIQLFGLEYNSETSAPVARLTATFRLMNTMEARIISTKQIDIKVPAGGMDDDVIIRALEQALEQGLAEVSAWTAGNIR